MTATQLRMAIGAANIKLRDLAEATGLDTSQISRIANEKTGASMETMDTLRRYFMKKHRLRFEARDGHVCVCAPDDE